MDIGLTDEVIAECSERAKMLEKIDFRIVYISPMKRTIQTAYYLFRNHSNTKNNKIRFIIHPLL
jgi:broad specificity phosphatase PhoE